MAKRTAARRTGMDECPYCGELKPKAKTYCSAKCGQAAERDEQYFDGMRRTAVGFDEKECWICHKKGLKSCHCHHVIGRKNDPLDPLLVALCPGCHTLVTKLAVRLFLSDPKALADLITLARFAQLLPNVRTVVTFEEVR